MRLTLKLTDGARAGRVLVVCIFAAVLLSGCGKKEKAPVEPAKTPDMSQQVPASYFNNSGMLTPASAPAVIVEVDGEKLTREELDQQAMQVMGSRAMTMPPDQMAAAMEDMRRNVIRSFIGEVLLSGEAKRQNIEPTEEEISSSIEDIKSTLPEGMTIDSALQTRGMTMDQLKSDMARGLSIEKLLKKEMPAKTEPTAAEIEAFYKSNPEYFKSPESVHARHVLIACPEGSTEAVWAEKKKIADACRKELAGGADFAAVAQKKSDCPSKEQGGDLGTFEKGQMVKEFEDAAFSQAISEIGQVVKTKFGYHVIQVLEHAKDGVQPLDKVSEKIAEFLQRRQTQNLLSEYVVKLAEKAKIQYADGIQPVSLALPKEQ